MSSAPTPAEIAADATWLAQVMDPAGGRADHAADIDGALAMLSSAAQESPLLRRALERSAKEG